MDDKNNNDNQNSVGYILGTIFGAICILCGIASVLALTIKFITWIL